MKKGKLLFYFLFFLFLGYFIGNTDVDFFEDINYSLEKDIWTDIQGNSFTDFSNKGLSGMSEYFLSLVVVLIFYLGIDKKVWKS